MSVERRLGCAVLLQIKFSPRLKHLAIIMGNLWTECVEVFTHFARLPNMLANKMSPKDVSAGKQFACVNDSNHSSGYFECLTLTGPKCLCIL